MAGKPLRESLSYGAIILGGFGILAAYTILLAGPIAIALIIADHQFNFPAVTGVLVFVVLSVIFESAAVVIGHWLGMLDFETATGRIGGS